MTSYKKNLSLAVFCCVLGWFFYTIMAACNKLISHSVSIFTILFFQNAICFLLTIPQVARNFNSLKTEKWGLHLCRDIIGVLASFLIFSALKFIPLVDSSLLQNTAPLWIPLILFVWLGIRIRRNLWWGNILGFVGIILILKPGAEALSVGAIYALASGIVLAFGMVVNARLSHTEPTNRTLFYYFLFGSIVTMPLAFFDFQIPSEKDLIYLISVGIFFYLGTFLTFYSFQHGKASVLGPITYSSVVFAGIFDYLIWNHLPNLLTFLGIVFVLAGALLSIHFENRYQKFINESKPNEQK